MNRIGEVMAAITTNAPKVAAHVNALFGTVTSVTASSKSALNDIRNTAQALGLTNATPPKIVVVEEETDVVREEAKPN